jgi:release factor glutamine methyltransferase
MQSQIEQTRQPVLRTGRAALIEGSGFLRDRHIESARLDAEVLLRHVLEMDPTDFYMAIDGTLNPRAEERFRQLLRRRGRREPLAYITGRKEFWSLDFVVTPDVLIPRPETELLVEVALERVRQVPAKPALNVLDLCTGSGAIAVSLAKELAGSDITALDISAAALAIARLNAENHGLAARMQFAQGDLFEPLGEQGKRFDLIISNPPYVRRRDLARLAVEICNWEPVIALDGGDEGLDFHRRIVADARKYSAPTGLIALEIGEDMADAVVRLFAADGGYEPAAVYRDYAGKDRVVTARVIGARG